MGPCRIRRAVVRWTGTSTRPGVPVSTPEQEYHTPMPRRTHAAIGAWTLVSSAPALAWGDAFRSIELVGDATARIRALSDQDAEAVASGLPDPIEVARTWLTDPARRSLWSPRLVAQAEETLQHAAAHLREIDILAGELAQDANDTGAIDAGRLEQVDMMAMVLQTYSARMRTLLDPAAIRVDEAERRLDTALAAAAQGGGLPALVAAIGG